MATALVWALLLTPHACGIIGVWLMDRFRRGAFGHYRAAATFLMLGILAGLTYYSLTLITLHRSGLLDDLGRLPRDAKTWFLYLQGVFAILALALFMAAGGRAWRIANPTSVPRRVRRSAPSRDEASTEPGPDGSPGPPRP